MHDLVVRDARICDGLGNAAVSGEVAVRDGRIVEIEARRIHDLPAGAHRLVTDAVGIHGVRVKEVRTLAEGAPCAEASRPGRVLRAFDA